MLNLKVGEAKGVVLTWHTIFFGSRTREQEKQTFSLRCNMNPTKADYLSKPTIPWMRIGSGFGGCKECQTIMLT